MDTKKTNRIAEKMWGQKAIHIPNTTDIYGADLVSSFVGRYITRTLCLLAKDHKITLPDTAKEEVELMVSYFNEIGLSYISEDNFIYIEGVENHKLSTVVMSYADEMGEFSDPSYTSIVPFTSCTAIELMGIKYGKKLRSI